MIPNIRVGVREIDIAAIRLQKGRVVNAIHVECQVSEKPITYLGYTSAKKRSNREIAKGVSRYVEKKFRHQKVVQTLKLLLGTDYEYWMIVGNFKGARTEFFLKKHKIRVYNIREVTQELIESKSILTGGGKRFQQLMKLTAQAKGS